MRPRDWFGVAVRIAALMFLVFALFDGIYVVAKVAGLETQSKLPLSADIAGTIFFAIFAGLGLLGAVKLVALSYRPD
jgi:hypothetical protein